MDFHYFAILSLNFFCFSSYSLPVSFYPVLAGRFGMGSAIIGVILATFPIGGIITSLLLGKWMTFIGKRKLLVMNLGVLIISMLLFAGLDEVRVAWLFLLISIIGRSIHGICFGGILSIAYGYVPVLYPNDIRNKMVIWEVILGISLSFGAFIGEVLFRIGGPKFPFLCFAVVYLLIIYPIYKFLPPDNFEKRNSTTVPILGENSESVLNNEGIDKTRLFKMKSLKYSNVIKNPLFVSTLGISYNYINQITMILSILPIYLIETNQQHLNAYCFLGISGVYSITTLIFSFGFKISSIKALFSGSPINILGLLLIGPAIDLGIPVNSYWLLFLGLAIFGFGAGIYFVGIVPYLIDIANDIYKGEDEELIGDIVSGLFSTTNFFGELIGPSLGGILYYFLGFPRTIEIFFIQGLIMVSAFELFVLFTNWKIKSKKLDSLNCEKSEG